MLEREEVEPESKKQKKKEGGVDLKPEGAVYDENMSLGDYYRRNINKKKVKRVRKTETARSRTTNPTST